jgi:hypothetical protein
MRARDRFPAVLLLALPTALPALPVKAQPFYEEPSKDDGPLLCLEKPKYVLGEVGGIWGQHIGVSVSRGAPGLRAGSFALLTRKRHKDFFRQTYLGGSPSHALDHSEKWREF